MKKPDLHLKFPSVREMVAFTIGALALGVGYQLSQKREIEINQPDITFKTDWNSINTVVDPKTGETYPMNTYYYKQLLKIRRQAEQTRNELAAKAFMERRLIETPMMCMELDLEKNDMTTKIKRAENNQLPTKASARDIEGEVICVPHDPTKKGAALLGLDNEFRVITAEAEDAEESSKQPTTIWRQDKPTGGDL
jgi:hypothetical protein